MNPQGARQLAEVRKLAPLISEQAAAIETARKLPPSLIDAFRSAGIFRMFVAREYGQCDLGRFQLPAAGPNPGSVRADRVAVA